jgi:Sugar-transfer associated ATP-grasp
MDVLSRLDRLGEVLLDVVRQAKSAVKLVLQEWRTRHHTRSGIGQRLARLRRGFLSISATNYGVDGVPDPRLYISDFHVFAFNRRPNRGRETLLVDKLVFWFAMRSLTPHVAPLLGLVDRGTFVPLDGDDGRVRPVEELLREAEHTLVLKPTRGGEAKGIMIIEPEPGQGRPRRVNGRPATLEAIARRASECQYVVAPFLEQATYAREIFPAALNTVRLMTMVDVATGRPFIPACIHRFGSSRTAPFDAIALGGLAAPVDLETGVMGPAVAALPRDGHRDVLDRHPETGARIAGVEIPHWPELRDHLLTLADRLRFLRYVAWDVAVTDDGFLINEGNSNPNLRGLQACGPILTDERVATFYRSYKVI